IGGGGAVHEQVVEIAGLRPAVGDVDRDAGPPPEVERDGVGARLAVDDEMRIQRRAIAAAVEQRYGVVAGAAADRHFAGKRLHLDGVAAVARAAAAADCRAAGHGALYGQLVGTLAQREVEEFEAAVSE